MLFDLVQGFDIEHEYALGLNIAHVFQLVCYAIRRVLDINVWKV